MEDKTRLLVSTSKVNKIKTDSYENFLFSEEAEKHDLNYNYQDDKDFNTITEQIELTGFSESENLSTDSAETDLISEKIDDPHSNVKLNNVASETVASNVRAENLYPDVKISESKTTSLHDTDNTAEDRFDFIEIGDKLYPIVDDEKNSHSTIREIESVKNWKVCDEDKSFVEILGDDAVDVTKSKEGGVWKKILREGEGNETPESNDVVRINFTGSLVDGTQVHTNRHSNKPFEFKLGVGSVIDAWDLAIATMKVSEVSKIFCTQNYAYGERGSRPKVPPNASLVYEIELVSWSGEDISEKKDGSITRSIIVKGSGYRVPKDGAKCTVHIVGIHDSKEFENRVVEFIMGEGQKAGLVEGVEQALRKFKLNEKSKIRVKAIHAYGEEGSEEFSIPPDTDLKYYIEMKAFEKLPETWEMDVPAKINHSERCKIKGTDFFKAGNYKMAARYYCDIVECFAQEEKLNELQLERVTALTLAAYLNLSLCYLKLNMYGDAIEASSFALKFEPKNEKGLFRRGMAYSNLQEYEAAIKDFEAVLEIDSSNVAAKRQLQIAKQGMAAAKERLMKKFSPLFNAAESSKTSQQKKKDLSELE